MKIKHFLGIGAIVAFAACGTPYRATDTAFVVPAETQRVFAQQYPNTSNVVWSSYDPSVIVVNDWDLAGWPALDNGDYVVQFDMDNENYYAWYDSDGAWVGTAYVVRDFTSLPLAINSTLNRDFPGYAIHAVTREYQKDRIAYEVVMKNNMNKVVLLLDSDGRIIKQKTK